MATSCPSTVAPVDVALTYGKRAIRAYLFVCVVAAVGEAPNGGGFGGEGGGGGIIGRGSTLERF